MYEVLIIEQEKQVKWFMKSLTALNLKITNLGLLDDDKSKIPLGGQF